MSPKPKLTSTQVVDCLIENNFTPRRAGDPVFVHLKEFRPSMGWHGDRRYIDLWVMCLSPANGMLAHSIEVKVSRSDWTRELKQPLKRRPAEAISNFMWLATPPGIAQPTELPAGWGLMEVDPTAATPWDRVRVVHSADHRDKVRPTWAFVGSALATHIRNGRPA